MEREQVLVGIHDLIESRLVDGQGVRVPRRDALLVQVHDRDLHVVALQTMVAQVGIDITCTDAISP